MYRYQLWRIWDEDKPKTLFIMLNPSTADHTKNDPTINRCIHFSKSWGFGGFYAGNLFPYRSKHPKDLLYAKNPRGNSNRFHIIDMAEKVDTVVCAWGNAGIVKRIFRGSSPYDYLGLPDEKLYYIDIAKDGTPKHPLFLRGILTLKKV